jgi:hypothetical protein
LTIFYLFCDIEGYWLVFTKQALYSDSRDSCIIEAFIFD